MGISRSTYYDPSIAARDDTAIVEAIWSGPFGPDRRQAADLTVGRGLRSSNCCGLR